MTTTKSPGSDPGPAEQSPSLNELDEVARVLVLGRNYTADGRRRALGLLPQAIKTYGKTYVAKRLGISRPTLDAWLSRVEGH